MLEPYLKQILHILEVVALHILILEHVFTHHHYISLSEDSSNKFG